MPPTLSAVAQKKHTTAGMFRLITHPWILDAVESVIGPEILVHPQFNLRGMLPGAQGVMFHQDLAFLDQDAEETQFANFWIPLQRINRYNGPLQVTRAN